MADPARPRFFDGQYIGADDLEAIGDYAASRQREHLLAAHGWGVAAGLDLIETAQPDGSVAVWLQPGYGWDGYGRAMAVRAPVPAPIDQLRGLPSGAWFAWLAYRESGRDAARASYGVCDGTDLYQRVMESCELRMTGALPLDLQQSGIAYGGATRPDARLARRAFDSSGPVVCDGAIPEQGAPPNGQKSLWLVPLGLIGWDDESQRLRALSETERLAARTMRRYVGAVAESILAPDGLIRLKNRNAAAPEGVAANAACGRPALTASDLAEAEGEVRPQELVWVEGDLRAYGDARLFGGALELRDRNGAAPQGAMTFRRRASSAAGAQDLEIAIGAAEGAGVNNRLLVGPAKDPADAAAGVTAALSVRADGRVGVGTDAPGAALDVRGGAVVSGVLNAQGGVLAGAMWLPSDARLKRDIRPLEGALETLLSLRGVSFEWRDAARGTGRQIGLIADEVERTLPNWVSTDPNGYKHISSAGFEGLAAEAMRVLLRRIEALEVELARRTATEKAATRKTEAAKSTSTPKPKPKPKAAAKPRPRRSAKP